MKGEEYTVYGKSSAWEEKKIHGEKYGMFPPNVK